jgi:hypothetical protein
LKLWQSPRPRLHRPKLRLSQSLARLRQRPPLSLSLVRLRISNLRPQWPPPQLLKRQRRRRNLQPQRRRPRRQKPRPSGAGLQPLPPLPQRKRSLQRSPCRHGSARPPRQRRPPRPPATARVLQRHRSPVAPILRLPLRPLPRPLNLHYRLHRCPRLHRRLLLVRCPSRRQRRRRLPRQHELPPRRRCAGLPLRQPRL